MPALFSYDINDIFQRVYVQHVQGEFIVIFSFVAMEIKSDVKTASALLDQFYEKRRLLIVSAPNISDPDYQLQNIMIQVRKLRFRSSKNSRNLQHLLCLCLCFLPESRLWIRPATRYLDRAPGLPAT